MTEPSRRSPSPSSFQISISSLTLGTLYEAVLAFSGQDRLETFWPSVCQNARWLIPSRRSGILLCNPEGSFEIVGMFEHGKFQKPADAHFTPEEDQCKRTLGERSAQWIEDPLQQLKGETGDFARWLIHDHPDMLFVLPMRVKGKPVGALLFAMASVADTDRAMLSTLGTIYALHVGMTYTLLRITEERKQLQNQLITQEKMASLGSLVAGIAHEINGPIGAIQSATDVVNRCVTRVEDLLGSGEGSEEISTDERSQKACDALKDSTAVIAAASDRIAKIVKSLKNFARLDQAEYQQASIHEGIDTTLTLLQSEFKDRITVIKEYGDVPEIWCFPGQLNQVFMGLLQNASEAIEGPGAIRVKTLRKGDCISIEIADSGRGIAPEKLKRVFDFDFSAKGSRVKMGAGLVTAFNIIQSHQGEITVESKPGVGSSFTITLPIDVDATAKAT